MPTEKTASSAVQRGRDPCRRRHVRPLSAAPNPPQTATSRGQAGQLKTLPQPHAVQPVSQNKSQVMDFGDNMAAAEVDATWPETEVSVRPEVW